MINSLKLKLKVVTKKLKTRTDSALDLTAAPPALHLARALGHHLGKSM